ncbi:MAG: tRNA preQ1(34) S-adenosylmethionine ribosyltransferase-isomerase QueA [Bacillota bacterium]|jgi:S-adenosylmethionine:tRNA ribosyltransferase-isomerase
MTNVSDFDYQLPERLIAQEPLENRDFSRLLVLDKKDGKIKHERFFALGDYLRPHDILVLNETKVLPARLFAHKASGAVIELLLLEQRELNLWQALVRPGRRVPVGTELVFPHSGLKATVTALDQEGSRLIRFNRGGAEFMQILEKLGQMPLPPYIKKTLEDQGRYQTVYASQPGSSAAPTAGLHFTVPLLKKLQQQGVEVAKLTLHVGLGTFRPVQVEKIEDHIMHREFYSLSPQMAAKITAAKAQGGRVIAVGTTSVRTLETLANLQEPLVGGAGWTTAFIYPGYQFKLVDAMITNFHLPKSTLLMLVSAFAGRTSVLHAYEEAIKADYRFFSFGDAMLIK